MSIIPNPPRLAASGSAAKYVQTELFSWFKNVTSALLRLTFTDNFSSFLVTDLTIPAGGTATITNQLRSIPSYRLIARQIGNGLVTDGDWTINTVQLINNGAVPVTISVIFFS